ncbi:hypothetical protein Taro_055495, partial [Colocasia esculenta]|nr:hypothetical protein [Colocasia esculenta]
GSGAIKSEAVRRRTGWPTLGRTPAVLDIPGQLRELCKRLDAAVLTTVFSFTSESVTRVRSSPRTLPLRRMRMGVPESATRARLPPGVLPQQERGDGGPR